VCADRDLLTGRTVLKHRRQRRGVNHALAVDSGDDRGGVRRDAAVRERPVGARDVCAQRHDPLARLRLQPREFVTGGERLELTLRPDLRPVDCGDADRLVVGVDGQPGRVVRGRPDHDHPTVERGRLVVVQFHRHRRRVGVVECGLQLPGAVDGLAADGGDPVTGVESAVCGGAPGVDAGDGDARRGSDRADHRPEQQGEGDDRDGEVVGDAGGEHPVAGAAVGVGLALLVGFDERADRDHGEEDEPQRVDVDVLDPAQQSVATLVDDQPDQEASDDLRRDRQREEVVDPGDDEEVRRLVGGRLGRVLERPDRRLEEKQEHPRHHHHGDPDTHVAPGAPEPSWAGEPAEEPSSVRRVDRRQRPLDPDGVRVDTAVATAEYASTPARTHNSVFITGWRRACQKWVRVPTERLIIACRVATVDGRTPAPTRRRVRGRRAAADAP